MERWWVTLRLRIKNRGLSEGFHLVRVIPVSTDLATTVAPNTDTVTLIAKHNCGSSDAMLMISAHFILLIKRYLMVSIPLSLQLK
jgi:hypothetical protein